MGELLSKKKDCISIVLAGEAGQGIQTVEYILTRVLKLSGYNIFSSKEFMSRIRGGTNSTEIRISSKRVSAFVDGIDILIPLSKDAVHHVKKRVSPNTIVLGEKENFRKEYKGSEDNIIDILAKGENIIQKNIEAGKKGYEIGSDLVTSGKIDIEIEKNLKVANEILLNGAEAVALGAIDGGCNFVSFYPMSPSTSVAVALDASFVARAFAADADKTKEILKKAIMHKGFALVDILQPCVTYNKVNTYKYFQENIP